MSRMQPENKEISWKDLLDEHWRQFKLACQSMNFGDKMPELNFREYVLYEMCCRHNREIGKEYFEFNDETVIRDEVEGQYV